MGQFSVKIYGATGSALSAKQHALIKNSITIENGYISVPTAPGLGIDVDEALARAHPYTGDGLHLQMQEDPIGYHGVNTFAGGAPIKA